ncbi:DUF4398 domain-containing protein [Myxococcus faecalis]|uniref:DUF4398 domain-containing protein n=1 Tax=Myxococcus TaxID=32 RepID=UPI00062436F8|nr:hypothetical protein MFUL124B02_01920 [Myxococcus fulvus 124B02]MBZ4395364.1 DUF4398 domain-containing protein [Myxococcus sp. AS-1-15]MBZ4413883.1 DUF4398 domain-containing protein [Myxococcus sp. XM-1-1-1]BDT30713.1 DUF4398 domain-containing protein [Myxococcus sp. MH1]
MRPKLLAAMLCATLLGCASQSVKPTSNTRRTEAVASMRAAEGAGAARIPEAARHLEFARQQVNHGEQLLMDDDAEGAELSFMQADADADLALALARALPMEQQAKRTTQQAEALRRGLQ